MQNPSKPYSFLLTALMAVLMPLSMPAARAATLDTPGELTGQAVSSDGQRPLPETEFCARLNPLGKIANYDTGWGVVEVDADGQEYGMAWRPRPDIGFSAASMRYDVDGSFSGQTGTRSFTSSMFRVEKTISIGKHNPARKPLRFMAGYSYLDAPNTSGMSAYSLWASKQTAGYALRYGLVFYDVPSLNAQTGAFLNLSFPMGGFAAPAHEAGNRFFFEYSSRDFYKVFIQHVVSANTPAFIGRFSTADNSKNAFNAGVQLNVIDRGIVRFGIYDLNQYRKPMLDFAVTY